MSRDAFTIEDSEETSSPKSNTEGERPPSSDWWNPNNMDLDKTARDFFPNGLEGTGEILVGMEATKTNAFMMRAVNAVLSFIAFIVLCSNSYMHKHLTPEMLFTESCYLRTDGHLPFTGQFNMTPYQWLIAIAFFVWFVSFGFATYYLLPVDITKRKYIPGFDVKLENFLNSVQNERVAYGAKSCTQKISDFFYSHSKQTEWVCDVTLLTLTLLISIICSIDVERGAKFTFGTTAPYSFPQWYTLGTFHLTFGATSPPCVTGGDPSDYIRAGLAMMYISSFFQALSIKISRDSYLKFDSLRSGDVGRDGSMPAPSRDDLQQRRGLMNNADDEDTVEVTL